MLSGKTIWERNINLLRLELVGAFNVDTFRRVLLECVIPWLTKSKASKVTKDKKEDVKKNDANATAILSGPPK